MWHHQRFQPRQHCFARLLDGRMASQLRPVTERRELMPEKATVERARQDKATGKAPTTQAGEFVREEMHHVREGKHGARSTKQAIAIGLSKARRAGVKLAAPQQGRSSAQVRKKAQQDLRKGQESGGQKPTRRRLGAVAAAPQPEG